MLSVQIVHRESLAPFPSVSHGGRLCFAVPASAPFAVRSEVHNEHGSRFEYVVAVDGRDTLTNEPASCRAKGLITGPSFVCKGFRIGNDGVHGFVCDELGQGRTTVERSTSNPQATSGLAAVAAYRDGRSVLRSVATDLTDLLSPFRGAGPVPMAKRGRTLLGVATGTGTGTGSGVASCMLTVDPEPVTVAASTMFAAGPTAGAVAGAFVADRIGRTEWKRGWVVGISVVEYDTPEGWATRGVSFASLDRDAWPGDAPVFCDPQSL